jgi:hypothetical protein
MKENEKSVVENTLLQIKAVEEAISENAKGILASTMKEEISELVKESLNGSKKSKKSLREQEEDVAADVVDTEVEGDEEGMEDETEVDVDSEDSDVEDIMGMEDETETEDDNQEMPPLDMTNASPDEVLKVFRAMGDNDGIIVKKDGPYVHLSDNETNKDYLIQVEANKKRQMKSKLNEEILYELHFEDNSSRFEDLDDYEGEEYMDDYEGEEYMDDEETLYELELDKDVESEMYEAFKPKGKVGKMKFKYPSKLKRGVTETSFDETEDDLSWEEEDEMYEDAGNMTLGQLNPNFGATPKDGSKGSEMYEEDEDIMGTDHEMYEEDEDIMGTDHEMYEEDEDIMGTDHEMYEAFKPKGKVGKMKFKYPSKLRKGVAETAFEGMDEEWNEEDESEEKPGEKSEASRTYGNGSKKGRGLRKGITPNRNLTYESTKEVQVLREKNEEYKKALDFFRNKLNEVAVFNSNLAYSTRLFTEHSTTKQEKINILRRFDDVETLKESKNLYKTIKNELDGKGTNNVVKESITERVIKTPQTGSSTNLIESKTYENPQFLRMKDLMTKIG